MWDKPIAIRGCKSLCDKDRDEHPATWDNQMFLRRDFQIVLCDAGCYESMAELSL